MLYKQRKHTTTTEIDVHAMLTHNRLDTAGFHEHKVLCYYLHEVLSAVFILLNHVNFRGEGASALIEY
jgi:hypothetical protein